MAKKWCFNKFMMNFFEKLNIQLISVVRHTLRHLYYLTNIQKQVHPLCAWIISQPVTDTISSMPYPLYLLPHVSSNNVGHLELKNLSAKLFFWSPNYKFWNLGTFSIMLERSWKYFFSSILHAPKLSNITIAKEKRKIYSC